MNLEIEKISNANYLPKGWDENVVDYFQTREFLGYTEKYNPCNQRYYVLFQDKVFKAGVVFYTLKLDLLTFMSASANIKMNIAGVPCSVSAIGFVGDYKLFPEFFDQIKNFEKGFQLFLNLDSEPVVSGVASGRTLPTITIENKFSSWRNYLQSIKSTYRRRIRLVSQNFTGIEVKVGTCSDFTTEMYNQYLEVLKRSKGKLETLSISFFQNLPSNFKLISYYNQTRLIGWYITTTYKERFYFFLGGIDYKTNKQHNTYFNMLINILKEGIESGSTLIDLGQTAEIPKMRLGGNICEKHLIGYHSGFLFRKMLIAGSGFLEYKARFPETHVFKQ